MAPPGELRTNAGVVWLAGNTVWSTPERIRGEVLTTMRYRPTNRRLSTYMYLPTCIPPSSSNLLPSVFCILNYFQPPTGQVYSQHSGHVIRLKQPHCQFTTTLFAPTTAMKCLSLFYWTRCGLRRRRSPDTPVNVIQPVLWGLCSSHSKLVHNRAVHVMSHRSDSIVHPMFHSTVAFLKFWFWAHPASCHTVRTLSICWKCDQHIGWDKLNGANFSFCSAFGYYFQ